MKRKNFHLSHSVGGAVLLIIVEGCLLWLIGSLPVHVDIRWSIILAFAFFGGAADLIVATEVIQEVRNASHMLVILSAVAVQFVTYFAFQYSYLISVLPGSFQGLGNNPIDLLLHSTMVFVFNPIYLPTNTIARGLLLINTFASLALVLFILQNIWQLRADEKLHA